MAHHSVWGPSGLIVEQVVRRAGKLTDAEGARLQEAWEAQGDDVDRAWGKVGYVLVETGRRPSSLAVALVGAATGDGATAALAAAAAASVSDLVGSHGLTAAHVDALLGPWLEVVGDPRVDPTCGCGTPPVTIDLGGLAPQPGDVNRWLVMAVDDEPEPFIRGYAADADDALRLADQINGPAILWRAGKETS